MICQCYTFGLALFGYIPCNPRRFGSVQFGSSVFGFVSLYSVQFGSIPFDSVRFGYFSIPFFSSLSVRRSVSAFNRYTSIEKKNKKTSTCEIDYFVETKISRLFMSLRRSVHLPAWLYIHAASNTFCVLYIRKIIPSLSVSLRLSSSS